MTTVVLKYFKYRYFGTCDGQSYLVLEYLVLEYSTLQWSERWVETFEWCYSVL